MSRAERRLGLRGRVAVLTALGVALAVVVVSLAGWWLMRTRMYENLNLQLRADTPTATRSATPGEALSALHPVDELPNDWRDQDLPPEAERLLGTTGPPPPIVVRFLGPTGDPVSSTPGSTWLGKVTAPAARVAADGGHDIARPDGTVYQVSTVPRPGGAAQVARRVTGIEGTLDDLRFLLVLIGFAGAGLAGVVGWAVARAGLRPVHRLTGAVEEVARTQDLDHAIPVDGHDEIARLATAFNGMLTALGASRAAQQQLVQDAGHELRTPLTSLRNNVELLTYAEQQLGSGKVLAPEDRDRLLRDLGVQAEELTTLTTELVELAADHTDPEPFEPVDLADVVDGAVLRARARWPRIVFAVSTTATPMIGRPAGLARAVLNLLDNASKWSPPGGEVQVRIQAESAENGVELTVSDDGPGISEEERPKIFERFYRATTARSMPGSGLGLAIVAQVVTAHGGRIDVGESPTGGAKFRIELPSR